MEEPVPEEQSTKAEESVVIKGDTCTSRSNVFTRMACTYPPWMSMYIMQNLGLVAIHLNIATDHIGTTTTSATRGSAIQLVAEREIAPVGGGVRTRENDLEAGVVAAAAVQKVPAMENNAMVVINLTEMVAKVELADPIGITLVITVGIVTTNFLVTGVTVVETRGGVE